MESAPAVKTSTLDGHRLHASGHLAGGYPGAGIGSPSMDSPVPARLHPAPPPPVPMPMRFPRLLDQVREHIRSLHYSRHTEDA